MCGAIFDKVRARNAAEDSMLDEVQRQQNSPYAAAQPPQGFPLWLKVGIVAVLLVVGALAAYNRFKPTQTPSGFIEGKPMVMEFWASWCGPCKVFGPVLEEVAGEYGSRISLKRVDVDEDRATAKEYGVNAIPLTLVFNGNGKVAKKIVGAVPASVLKEAIDSAF